MGADDPGDLTGVLHAVRRGEPDAESELFDRVYRELHKMAHGRLLRERRNPTLLQTTALVNEAYMRLVRKEPANFENRAHFFGAAVRAMRRILVDYARRRDAEIRGGGTPPLPLHELSNVFCEERAEQYVEFDAALTALAKYDAQKCRIIEYQFFGGLTVAETAQVMGLSVAKVKRDRTFARAWLYRLMRGDVKD